jgi:UDP-N-acetylmuramoyl-L-alanyl-D-glutamate--2,6-diaminopimelate ligase
MLVADLIDSRKSLIEIATYLGDTGIELSKLADIDVTDVTSDSSTVSPGALFVAVQGLTRHGAEFARRAIKDGAVAILTDRDGEGLISQDGQPSVPILVVSRPEIDLGHLAHWFHGDPMRSMHAVGITGTNGKSTTTTLLYEMWDAAGFTSGLMGTVATIMPGVEIPAERTTESADLVARRCAQMAHLHVRSLAMEVSSHGLSLHRINGARFAAVGFTNLSQDHLDYHGDMENYFAAKSSLFTHEFSDRAVINIDDPYGLRLSESTSLEVISLSLRNSRASWSIAEMAKTTNGTHLQLRGPGGIMIESEIQLLGSHNVENYLMAVAFAVDSGVDPLVIAEISPRLRGAAGRMEQVNLGQPFRAFVDYAHSPDAVERVLKALRENIQGRVIAVLGCGGDRDRSKRPLMGKALQEGSDIAIFTSDNPRSEDPESILAEMVHDVTVLKPSAIEVDRREAIKVAVSLAQPGDAVIILGKGHEKGQYFADRVEEFDDRLELARAIEARG